MAISGSLKDVKFVEILKIAGKRTGRLWIYNFDSHQYYEWYVNEQTVCAVRVNRQPVTLAEQIYQAAAALSRDDSSSYIFYKLEVEKLPQETNFSIEQITLNAIAAINASDELESHLPNADTRFSIKRRAPVELVGELKDFWNRCEPHLTDGFSANDLAAKTNLDVRQIQLNLYKLKVAAIIQPVRIVALSGSPFAVNNVEPPEPTRSQSSEKTIESQPVAARAETEAAPERKSLVMRMLGAIASRKKLW